MGTEDNADVDVDLQRLNSKLTTLRDEMLPYNNNRCNRYLHLLQDCLIDTDVIVRKLGFAHIDEPVLESSFHLNGTVDLVWNAIDVLRNNQIDRRALHYVKKELKMAINTILQFGRQIPQ